MAELTFEDYLTRYGPEGGYPVVDLNSSDTARHTLIITFGGGTKKAIVDLFGLAAGRDGEHLCMDVHAFVDGRAARASVFGLEDGARYEGFDQTAPGRSHGRPAVRGVTVLIGAQSGPDPQP